MLGQQGGKQGRSPESCRAMNQDVVTLRCERTRLLQHINELAIGRDPVVWSGKGKDREALPSIERQQISSRLLPALLYFCQENDCGNVDCFQIVKEFAIGIKQPKGHRAAIYLAGEIERV